MDWEGDGDQDAASLNLWFLGDQSDNSAAEAGELCQGTSIPWAGLSASKEPAEKFPKKHRRWAKSNSFCKGQILLYLASGWAGALCCHSHQNKLLLHQGCAC